MESQYCINYNPAVEKLLDAALPDIADDVKKCDVANAIKFVVLGGGYGRGDGGIIQNADGEAALYNDLDFFIITKEDASAKDIAELKTELKKVSEKWTERLGIDVDFSEPRSAKYVAERLDQMMWKEMALGAKVLVGDPSSFNVEFGAAAKAELRAGEAAKLMFNRCYGLLLAIKRLEQKHLQKEDFDFIARNINKTVLASADILLLQAGFAPYKMREKLADFQKLDLSAFAEAEVAKNEFAAAARFKAAPSITEDTAELAARAHNAARLACATADFARIFLQKSGKKSIKAALKNLKNNMALAKKFATFGVGFKFFENPAFTALGIFCDIFKTKTAPSDLQMQTITEIWKSIN